MEQANEILHKIAKHMPDELRLTSKQLTAQEYEQRKADLYNESVGNLNEQDGYDCPACKNKGYIAEVRFYEMYGYYAEALQPCKCHKARNALRRLARSGLKDVVKKYTFEKYVVLDAWQQAVKDKAVQFCSDTGNHWFFIGGQSGCGKSHLCTAIAIHMLRCGKDVRYMMWRDENRKLKAVSNDAEQYEPLMKELKETPVLYIDDLFKVGNGDDCQTKPTPADINNAFEIINYRYLNPELVTIISSERVLGELLDIDEATAGRIAERTKDAGYCINIRQDRAKNWRMRGIEEF